MRENNHLAEHTNQEFLLTIPDYHARMTPVSGKETPGWRKYPAANLLDEDYLGSIVRYNIE